VKFIAQKRIFYSERAKISIYEKSPNEVVNTNNVAHRRCSNECDSILM